MRAYPALAPCQSALTAGIAPLCGERLLPEGCDVQAVRVHEQGGPDSMRVETIPIPSPGPGEALVRLKAIGVNFLDVYQRSGLYKMETPFTPGNEGAGVVELTGAGVTEVVHGDRVAWAMQPGAYAEYAVVPAWKLAPIPETLSFQLAAASLLQGMTVHYLTRSTFSLGPGHRAVIHAAAGGVGLMLVQVAKTLGATVFATVGNDAKADLVRSLGADHVIIYTRDDFQTEVMRLTEGKGVHVVYDSVGKETFERSLKCLAPRGCMVLFGTSSGKPAYLDPSALGPLGSLYLTRPTLANYMMTRQELLERSGELFRWLAGGLQVRIDSTFPLEQAAEAHRRLESRSSSGKILLVP